MSPQVLSADGLNLFRSSLTILRISPELGRYVTVHAVVADAIPADVSVIVFEEVALVN